MKICPSVEELSDFGEERICPQPGCGKIFQKLPNLQMHLVKRHKIGKMGDGVSKTNVQYYCPISSCKYNLEDGEGQCFTQRRLLKQHFVKVHAPKDWQCLKCGWSSAIHSAVQRHLKTCTKTKNASYPIIFEGEDIKYININADPVKLARDKIEKSDIFQEHNYSNRIASIITKDGQIKFIKIGDKCNVNYKSKESSEESISKDNNDEIEGINKSSKQSDVFTQTLAKTTKNKAESPITLNVETQTIENNLNLMNNDQTTNHNILIQSNITSSEMYQDIETQTALDELLYSKHPDSQYEDMFSDFTLLSDTQTQTWPSCEDFDLDNIVDKNSKSDSVLISTETQTCKEIFEYDYDCDSRELLTGMSNCFKETQTCDCFLTPNLSVEHCSKINSNTYLFSNVEDQTLKQYCKSNSTETQTSLLNLDDKFLIRKSDVLLSYSSTESQTCDMIMEQI